MNYKCKFCGYRFKDKDEQICPECLTAREEDISCGVYGEQDHSHEIFNDLNTTSTFFKKNDTFRDGNADFLKEEHRYENRVETARYERKNGGDINIEADPRRRYASASNNARMSSQNYYRSAQPVKNNNNGCGKGCIVFFVIIVLVLMGIGFYSEYEDDISEMLGNEEQVSTETAENGNVADTEEKTDPSEGLPVALRSADCDIDIFLSKETIGQCMSNDEDLPEYVKDSLSFFDGEDAIPSYETYPRDCDVIDLDLLVLHSDKTYVDTDSFEIKSVVCIGLDSSGNNLSYYEGSVSDRLLYVFNENSSLKPKLLCDKTAAEVYAFVDAVYNGQDITFTIQL